jgi:hypothetical protein
VWLPFRSLLLPIAFIKSGITAYVWSRVCNMASLNFDLPQLDYTARFSLWQVKGGRSSPKVLIWMKRLMDLPRKICLYELMRKSERTVRVCLWFNFIYPIIFCSKCCLRNRQQTYGRNWIRSACQRILPVRCTWGWSCSRTSYKKVCRWWITYRSLGRSFMTCCSWR